MTKAIFFDVDGTLVSFKTHQISPACLSALHRLREKGILLFISTGRHLRMLDQLAAVFPFDGFVTLSGQYCCAGKTVLRSVPMEPAAVDELALATAGDQFPCIFLEGQEIYLNYADHSVHQFMQDLHLPLPPAVPPEYARGRQVYQAIAFLSQEREHLLLDRAPHLKTTRWHPDFLDVIPSGGGKDKGLEVMAAHFGIDLADTMAFGDGENDLSMLLRAGIGVAMGSASPAVQSQASYVTGTVDQDGIPSALAHFGLLE